MIYKCLYCKRDFVEIGMNTGSIQWILCNICLPQFKLVIDGKRKILEKEERKYIPVVAEAVSGKT